MVDFWTKQIGKNRGAPRVFLDGQQAVRAGFSPGDRFDIEVEGHRVTLRKNDDGSRVVSRRVSGNMINPVIDINSKELLSVFDGMKAVRIVVKPDAVYILPLASEVKKVERLNRLIRKVQNREPLLAGSVAHGGGILANAVHTGLRQAGVECEMAFANEIREDLLVHAVEANEVWSDGSSVINLPIQEAAQDDWLMAQLPKLEILEMGLPCSGASKAGKAKRGNVNMEAHPEVGHLVVSALMIINKTQPVAVLMENVVDYASSGSADILRNQFRDMGYTTHEAILSGKDFGMLENRVRWCLVAVTQGVDFDFQSIAPQLTEVRRLGDVLEPIEDDDPRWRAVPYLADKQERDLAAGKGFRMQVVTPDATNIGVLRRGYQKGGSTDPRLAHPTDPERSRLLTAKEHARVKGVPDHLVEGLSETLAHQLLGQGIVYDPFVAVGDRIGEALQEAVIRATGLTPRELLAQQSEQREDEEENSSGADRLQRMTG